MGRRIEPSLSVRRSAMIWNGRIGVKYFRTWARKAAYNYFERQAIEVSIHLPKTESSLRRCPVPLNQLRLRKDMPKGIPSSERLSRV